MRFPFFFDTILNIIQKNCVDKFFFVFFYLFCFCFYYFVFFVFFDFVFFVIFSFYFVGSVRCI
ncbi:hypothetical protein DLS64_13580 [Staphylococcus pseudintermedius]|nr:hypothetical protein DLS64_13580 [Staphylococcus pseudintermedius]